MLEGKSAGLERDFPRAPASGGDDYRLRDTGDYHRECGAAADRAANYSDSGISYDVRDRDLFSAVSDRREIRLGPSRHPGDQLCLSSQPSGNRRSGGGGAHHHGGPSRRRNRRGLCRYLREEDPPALSPAHHRDRGFYDRRIPLSDSRQLYGRRRRKYKGACCGEEASDGGSDLRLLAELGGRRGDAAYRTSLK